MAPSPSFDTSRQTRILPVNNDEIGTFVFSSKTGAGDASTHPEENSENFLDDWTLQLHPTSESAQHLKEAAQALRAGDFPVAFPTETVYGLGADATSSTAVQGIYRAKQRPSDNPLIVHVASLTQLRGLLGPPQAGKDPLPAIYLPLIRRFWPGPLTILLPSPPHSVLAPEVTASQPTFAARIPSSRLALALIQLSTCPLAAPSANASTRPSPTQAEHVLHDLRGRIDLILDGGACDIGVESTVVDGLSDLPCILRPGGISLEQIRAVPGWEHCIAAWTDRSAGDHQDSRGPRAPGMKYRHYAPTATVILIDPDVPGPESILLLLKRTSSPEPVRVGILRTKSWTTLQSNTTQDNLKKDQSTLSSSPAHSGKGATDEDFLYLPKTQNFHLNTDGRTFEVLDIQIGPSTVETARGLFAGLRELDGHGVQMIFVEGIDEHAEGAAAVMNRLRKAAEQRIDVKAWEELMLSR